MDDIKIYTSYFSMMNKFDVSQFMHIRCSASIPSWLSKPMTEIDDSLYPKWYLLNQYKNGEIDWETYKSLYIKYLEKNVNKEEIKKQIIDLMKEKGYKCAVLFCWEKDAKHCHRTILAEWLFDEMYVHNE